MKHKKSQMIGQVFIYILTLLIIVMVFFFGYKAINTFKDRSCDIDIANFKQKLSSTVRAITPDFESVETKSFSNPCGKYVKICFVKNFDNGNDKAYPSSISPNLGLPKGAFLLINDALQAKKENTFLVEEDTLGEAIFVGNIDVDSEEGALCVPVLQNKIEIRFEGKGNHAKISLP